MQFRRSVTHVAGQICYLCTRIIPEAGLTGAEADHVLAVPSADGEHIQEVHLMLLHFWCAAVDDELANAGS